MLKYIVLILISAFVLFMLLIIFVRRNNRNASQIRTENGISESFYQRIGGIDQFLNIRGNDRSNPVILVLHGGPGSPISFLASYWQKTLEKEYTLVNWDQRGAGRTAMADRKNKTPEVLGTEILLSDLDELVGYLTDRFGQEKIYLLGHSWGTILGSLYVKRHPENIRAYIGVGQAVDMAEGEKLAKDTAILRAEDRKDEGFREKVDHCYDIFTSVKESDMKNFMRLHALCGRYLRSKGALSTGRMIWNAVTSPDFSGVDARWQMFMMFSRSRFLNLNAPLMHSVLEFRMADTGLAYGMPVVFISGDGDWVTPYPLIRNLVKNIKAPSKEMILIENAGHNCYLDRPEVFSKVLMKALKNS
jgi:pimeloyl-ACP methyl ester carboxylesterase